MQRLLPLLALVLIGCSSDPGKNPDPVNITGSVSLRGVPVTDVVLNLQPTSGGHPVAAVVTEGKFQALVTPGKYCYFVTEGESPVAFNVIPKEYREATLDLRDGIVVNSGTSTLNIELD